MNKKDSDKDVLEKVTLIKDIRIDQPHRAHIEILNDLHLSNLNVSDFDQLHKAFKIVLNTKELNNKFYKELSNWYFWALTKVHFPKIEIETQKNSNSIALIRLITRIIFIWFMKERQLIPISLFKNDYLDSILKFSDKNESSYYKAILQNLFFATLNQEIEKRDFRKEKQNFNITTLYRYEEYFNLSKEEVLAIFKDIPFLNGGLFECLDKPHESKKGKQGGDAIIRIDAFSDRSDNPLKVPNELFFLEKEKKVDLNSFYGTKNKEYKVLGLLEILKRYKFTVEENTPIEEEIALDPELLGQVFENLLASYNPETKATARKSTGSYYTPRPIVDYMVSESLKISIANLVANSGHLGNTTDEDIKTGLDILFSYSEKAHAFNEKEVEEIIRVISNIRILDPACGSGAFPMGILNKLVSILTKLDNKNIIWRELQKERAIKETEEAYDEGNKEERHQRLSDIEETFNRNSDNYGRKLFLIENSIFGVDKQPIAVQISKLRFFISLLVDEKIDKAKSNWNIRPMPNLETKFVAANTLIGIDKNIQKDQFEMFNYEIKGKENELKEVRHKHFSAKTQTTKKKYRDEDKKIREEIKQLLINDNWQIQTAEKLANWDLYDQNFHADFFDKEWMFGLESGFDIIIGNPPYIKEYTDKHAFDGLRRSKYYQGKMDLWYFFACTNIDLLVDDGILCFIATNNWISNTGASILREKIINEAKILEFVDFGDYKIFESAGIQTMVFINKKTTKNDDYHTKYSKLLSSHLEEDDLLKFLEKEDNVKFQYLDSTINKQKFQNKNITFISKRITNVLDELELNKNFELNEKEVAQGIVFPQDFLNSNSHKILGEKFSVGDGIFALNELELENLKLTNKEMNLIKPYYTTKEIHKYYGNNQNKYWLIYTSSEFRNPEKIKPFPNLKKHLDKFSKVITSDNRPYGLHRTRKETFFVGEKIVALRKCSKEPIFTYTDFDCYVSATFYVIKTERINLKYLTALLNSKLIAFWLRYRGKMQGNNYQIDKAPILSIPIKKIESIESIVTLVDIIIFLKSNSNQISEIVTNDFLSDFFEEIINAIFFELYFSEDFNKAEIEFISYAEHYFQSIEDKNDEEKVKIIQNVYENLSSKNNEIRNNLKLMTIRLGDLLNPILRV